MLGKPEARGLGESGGDTQLNPSDRSPSCGERDVGESGNPGAKGRCAQHSLTPKDKGQQWPFSWLDWRERGWHCQSPG